VSLSAINKFAAVYDEGPVALKRATNGEIGRGLPSLRNTAQDDVMTSQAALYHPTQDAMANALDRG